MRKKLQKKAVTLASSLVKHIKMNAIMAFPEKPSQTTEQINAANNEDDSRKHLEASDLFSMFTADIIKKEVTFTR
jgi:hypothetical protein